MSEINAFIEEKEKADDGGGLEKCAKKSKMLNSWTSGLRERATKYREKLLHNKFAITSKFVVCSKVLSDCIPSRNCDVIVTLPPQTANDVIMWVVTRIRTRTPEIKLKLKVHSKSGDFALYLTVSHDNLLKGAEELGLRKPLKEEYGGGCREFVYEEKEIFEGVEEEGLGAGLNVEGESTFEDKGGQFGVEDSGGSGFWGRKSWGFGSNGGGKAREGVGFVGGRGFLSSEERQSIVHYMLLNLRAVEGDVVAGVKLHAGQAIVPVLLSRGIISQVLPLHNHQDLAHLRKKWVQAFFNKQPLDHICRYFGVKIGMYFSYLGHYTHSLLWPALFGVLLWMLSGTSQFMDDVCFVLFAVFNVIWTTLYLEGWKRRSAECAHHWNIIDEVDELLLEPRALFHGDVEKSRVTGRLEATYPSWKRSLFKGLVSYPLIAACLAVVFVVVWLFLELQGWVNGKVEEGKMEYWSKFVPKVLLAISISALDESYKRIATWLNDKENYRLDVTYEKHLILKLVMFQFVNSFLSLFYIAFYLQNMTQLQEHLAALLITRQVVGNLKETIQPFIVEKVKMFRSLYARVVKMNKEEFERMMNNDDDINIIDDDGADDDDGRVMSAKMNSHKVINDINSIINSNDDDDDGDSITIRPSNTAIEGGAFSREGGGCHGGRKMSLMLDVGERLEGLRERGVVGGGGMGQAEVESFMKKYEDTYEDYLEMFIQFGYVTLFSSSFPLAALCALLNNVVEVRSDAFKLCFTLQRPFGQRVQNIGIWQPALELMSVVAIMVNSALIGMSGLAERLFPGWGTAERIVSIVIIEHVVLGLRLLVAYLIPDVPEAVVVERARLEFMRREALKKQKRNSRISRK